MKIYCFSEEYRSTGKEPITGCVFDASFYQDALNALCKKVHDKYPNVIIGEAYTLSITKRENENFITVSGRFCLGDGDYVNRSVEMPFPDVSFAANAGDSNKVVKAQPPTAKG